MLPPEARPEFIYSTLREDPDVAELLTFFVDELPPMRSELRKLGDEGQFELLRREAHKLRGSAGGYGFQGVSDLAGKLENSCKIPDRDPASILQTLDDLLDYLGRVRI